jgi:hypothetical protein
VRTNRTTLALLGCMALAAPALAACGEEEEGSRPVAGRETPQAAEPLVVEMRPRHGSGVSGTAELTPVGEDLRVVLTVGLRSKHSHLAHIHDGPCKKEPTWANPRINATLEPVSDGESDTTFPDMPLESLRRRSYSINVHEYEYPNRPLACGDIPRA